MSFSLSALLSFVGRHWLRLCLVAGALFLLTERQVAFDVRFGGPAPNPPAAAPPPGAEPTTPPAPAPLNPEPTVLTDAQAPSALADLGTSLLGGLSLFGKSEPTLLDQLARTDAALVPAYVRRFSHVAQAEREKFGIPASITLASAILYGRAGAAPLVTTANAYFALPCDGDYRGRTASDARGRCYRAYENAWTSFRDHSLYLTSGRFQPLTQFGPHDYRRWAAGLEELGFNATDDLAAQLLTVIDRYQLFQYD